MERPEHYPMPQEPDKAETPAKKQMRKALDDEHWKEVDLDKPEQHQEAA
jgi:hypothetical protein